MGKKAKAAQTTAERLHQAQGESTKIQIESIRDQLAIVEEGLIRRGVEAEKALAASLQTLTASSEERERIVSDAFRATGLDERDVQSQVNDIFTALNTSQFNIARTALKDAGIEQSAINNLAQSISAGGISNISDILTKAEQGATAIELKAIVDSQRVASERGVAGLEAQRQARQESAQSKISGIKEAAQQGVAGASKIRDARIAGIDTARGTLQAGSKGALQAGATGQELFNQGGSLLLQAISGPIEESPFVLQQIEVADKLRESDLAAAGLLDSGIARELKDKSNRAIIAAESVRRQGLLVDAVRTGQVSSQAAQNIMTNTGANLAKLGVSEGDIIAEQSRRESSIQGETALATSTIEADRQKIEGDIEARKQQLLSEAELSGIQNTAEGQAALARSIGELDAEKERKLTNINLQAEQGRSDIALDQIQRTQKLEQESQAREAGLSSSILSDAAQSRLKERQGLAQAQSGGVLERGNIKSQGETALGNIKTGTIGGLTQASSLATGASGSVLSNEALNRGTIEANKNTAKAQATSDALGSLIKGIATVGGGVAGFMAGGPAGAVQGASLGSQVGSQLGSQVGGASQAPVYAPLTNPDKPPVYTPFEGTKHNRAPQNWMLA